MVQGTEPGENPMVLEGPGGFEHDRVREWRLRRGSHVLREQSWRSRCRTRLTRVCPGTSCLLHWQHREWENRCSRLLNLEQVTFKTIYIRTHDPLSLPSASIKACFWCVLPEFRVQVNTVITAGTLSCFPTRAVTWTFLPRCGDPPLYLRLCLGGRRRTGPLIISGVSDDEPDRESIDQWFQTVGQAPVRGHRAARRGATSSQILNPGQGRTCLTDLEEALLCWNIWITRLLLH